MYTRSILLVIILAFVILTLFYYENMNLQNIYAASPPFVRHEIEDIDDINDLQFRNETINEINYLQFLNNSKKVPQNPWQPIPRNFDSYFERELGIEKLGIESVSYFSDGKILNTTFWLSSPFDDKPTVYIPTYQIFIDVDSNSKTGVDHGPGGADYAISVTWNNSSGKWEKYIAEGSVSESFRILNKTDNYKAFFGDKYVTTSVDLSAIGSPDQFLVTFEVVYGIMSSIPITLLGGNSEVKDILPWISVPEPQFLITPSPSTLTLKPGERKIVEIRINSNVNLESVVALSTENGTGSIESSFKPPEIDISPNGIGTSYLHVKAEDNALPQTFTFPVYESLSFPSTHINYTNAAANIGSYLTIIVEDYPFSKQFTDFWSTYGDAISLIGGGFIGGFSGFMFARLEKKKKNTDDSKDKTGQVTN